MALSSVNQPLGVSISSVDNNRQAASTSLWLPPDSLLADADTWISQAGPLYQALTLNRMTRASLLRRYVESAPLAVITPAAESERKLVLVFDVGAGQGTVVQEVPSPVFDIETDGTDEVDPADPLVAAWVNHVVNGAIGPANGAVNQYNIGITGLVRAYVAHRGRGRGR